MSQDTSKEYLVDYQVPVVVRCLTSDGLKRIASILEIFPGGLFVEMRSDQLPYMERVHIEVVTAELPLITFDAVVAIVVRGRGVRLEAVPETPAPVFEAIADWAAGKPAVVAVERHKEPRVEVSPPPEAAVEIAIPARPLRETHVLVVDDDPLVLRVLERMLRTMGCRVTTTSDPPEALEILQQHVVDTVLLDWILPRIPGQDMLAKLTAAHRDVPVAIISGGLWWENAERQLFSMGAAAVLRKPLSIAEIRRWISAVSATKLALPQPQRAANS